MTAKAIEARKGGDSLSGSVEDESAVPQEFAQGNTSS
jgi:hypothetical protein